MVTIDSKNITGKRPLFIYITGCDGTGKSTQANLLRDWLIGLGIRTNHLWLRFPFLLSLPLLLYARLRRFSWHEENGTIRHGYWDFRTSRLLQTVFPWTLLVDASVAAVFKIYVPRMMGTSIVCERFVLDMLVDMSLAFDKGMHKTIPGKLFLKLLPSNAHIFLLDLDEQTIRQRRADLLFDKNLTRRLVAFKRLAAELGLPIYSSQASMQMLCSSIQAAISLPNSMEKQ